MNKQQVEMIKRSVKEFNDYRKSVGAEHIDLWKADLSNLDLQGINLDYA